MRCFDEPAHQSTRGHRAAPLRSHHAWPVAAWPPATGGVAGPPATQAGGHTFNAWPRGRHAFAFSLAVHSAIGPHGRVAAGITSPGGCSGGPMAAPRLARRLRLRNAPGGGTSHELAKSLSESLPSTVHPFFFFFNRAKQSAIPRAAPSPRPVGSHWHGARLLPLARYSSPSRRAIGTAGRHGRPGPGDTDSLSVIGGRTVTVAQAPGRTPGFCRPGHTLNTTPSSLASITMIIGAARPLAVHHGQNRRHGHWHEARCYDLPLLPSAQTF